MKLIFRSLLIIFFKYRICWPCQIFPGSHGDSRPFWEKGGKEGEVSYSNAKMLHQTVTKQKLKDVLEKKLPWAAQTSSGDMC